MIRLTPVKTKKIFIQGLRTLKTKTVFWGSGQRLMMEMGMHAIKSVTEKRISAQKAIIFPRIFFIEFIIAT